MIVCGFNAVADDVAETADVADDDDDDDDDDDKAAETDEVVKARLVPGV